MRKIVYIFIGLIIVSCAKHEASKSMDVNAVEAIEETETFHEYKVPTDDDLKFNTDNSINNEYQNLAITKLKEISDLINLKQQHPEFKDDIEAQLNTLIQKNTALQFLDSNSSIENILQKGNMEKVSDSIQKMTLYFNIVSENKTIKDSLDAFITSKIVIIDGNSVKTNKIRFSKIE